MSETYEATIDSPDIDRANFIIKSALFDRSSDCYQEQTRSSVRNEFLLRHISYRDA